MLLFSCKGPATDTLFTALPAQTTGITFENTLPEQSPGGMNIIQYLYYYNGGGVAAGDVNNDGWCDLYFTSNLGPNKLYLNRGNFNFEDVTEKAGVAGSGSWKTGVTMADVNADGWLDIYVCQVGNYKSFSGKNQLFINNHDGTFSEKAAEYGLDLSAFCTQAAFFDFDLDNDLDVYILCHSVHGPGNYRDTASTRVFDPSASDRMLINHAESGRRFEPLPENAWESGGSASYGLGLAVGDIDGNGYPDVYVGNDFHENDYLLLNPDGRSLRESIAASMGHTSNFTMGCDLADCNNDALPDLVSLDMKPEDEFNLKAGQPADQYDIHAFKHELGYHWQFARNNLQLNRGNMRFSEIGQLCGVAATDWSWSALFTDLDMDGWKDLYITNGILRRPNDMDYIRFISSADVQKNASDLELLQKMPSGLAPNYAFRNNGNLSFENVAEKWGLQFNGSSNGAVYADLDNDGDPDLVSNNLNAPASVYRNNTANARFIKIQLRDTTGKNTFCIGAKVYAWNNNQVQYFENQPVRGFQSAVEPGCIVVGLGQAAQLDSLRVLWPGGKTEIVYNVPAGNTLHLFPPSEARSWQAPPAHPERPLMELPGADQATEKRVFNEKLVPWFLNTQGPGLAVADVNADGLDDVFSGNTLYLQNARAGFRPVALPLGNSLVTAAAFFDADADGDPDLYTGSGDGQTPGRDSALLDVLWLNDGKGNFDRAAGALPPMFENTSCVRPCDVDADGDLDLFAGGRSVVMAYGMSPGSYLLQNDGAGHFTDITPDNMRRTGMVTDASWTDLNADGRPDLLLCGEWMPITLFLNTASGFEKQEIPGSAGLWNCLTPADWDGDGDTDWLAGNLGLNSILQAGSEEPLGLWIKDFDRNNTFDPVLTYYRQGKNYVFADKDWLLGQLPVLKKNYVEYRKYAADTWEDIFPSGMREGAIGLRCEVLASCLLENRGSGQLVLSPLPVEAQFSPVFDVAVTDWNTDGRPDALLGGNFYEVQPAIGRFDAGMGLVLLNAGSGQFNTLGPERSGLVLEGAVRALAPLKLSGGRKALAVARRDRPPVLVLQ